MTSAHQIGSTLEAATYGIAFNIAGALEAGLANAAARREADREARAEAATVGQVAQIARAMAADRLAMRRLQAENDALRAELSALQQRAARAEAALIRARG